MLHKKVKSSSQHEPDGSLTPLYNRFAFANAVSRHEFPQNEMLPADRL